jgi:hypothetical protein
VIVLFQQSSNMANHLLSMRALHTLHFSLCFGKPKRHIALSIGVARNVLSTIWVSKAEVEKTYHHCSAGMKLLLSVNPIIDEKRLKK